MIDTFSAARLKIKRAEKHITDIEGTVKALKDNCTCVVERDPQQRGTSIKYEIVGWEVASHEVALITGDSIHNLKSALDFAWVGALGRIGLPDTKYTKFPVADTLNGLEAMLKSTDIASRSPALHELMVQRIKPYDGGDSLIHDLHRLDITDKHKLIIPVANYASVSDIAVEDKRTGNLHPGSTWGFTSTGPFRVDFDNQYSIKEKGKLSFSIVFGKGEGADGFPIIDTLKLISGCAQAIVKLLESFPVV